MHEPLREFVARLAARPHTQTLYNPYREPAARQNLLHYLALVFAQRGRRILVVGEALGYRGGRLTGIPLSSERLLRQAPHSFLRELRKHVLVAGDTSEATATLVWTEMAGRRRIPLFWNACPFHPHQDNNGASNRAPSAAEIEEGISYLAQLAGLYQPVRVAGLGNKGYLAATSALSTTTVARIRHPSYGGKSDFRQGLARLLAR